MEVKSTPNLVFIDYIICREADDDAVSLRVII